MIESIEFDQQHIPLEMKLLGINHHQEPVQRTQGFPYYQWFFCKEGRGELIINNQRMILSENHGMLIYPNEPYSMHGLTPVWKLHFFGFSGEVCNSLLKSMNMFESGVYFFSDSSIFETNIQEFIKLHKIDNSEKPYAYSKACYSCLLDLSRCISRIHSSEPGHENELIKKTVSYLELNYSRTITLDELADTVQLSKEYLCFLFKESMGQTIMNFLLNIRIARARFFLSQYPGKTVKDIAFMCGFESPSYFCHVFKKAVGTTPDKYRLHSAGRGSLNNGGIIDEIKDFRKQ